MMGCSYRRRSWFDPNCCRGGGPPVSGSNWTDEDPGSGYVTKGGCSRSEGEIFVAKNGTFLEKESLTKEVTGRKVELDEVVEPSLEDQSSAVLEDVLVQPAPIREEANDNDHETSNEVATEPRRSTRERTTPDWYDPCLNVMIVDNNDEDSAMYEEAMMSPDSNKWQEAMKSEMGSMYDNKVCTLVDLPDSRKAVENKWIFKRKTDADGNVTVYKARLVAKGFRQIQGVDYDETFSPVAKLKSVRILLAIAAFFDYEIWQMDVKTAFLNGDIEEELYMVQPKGFVDSKNADKEIARNCEYPTKVEEFMDFQARKANSQTATCYDNVDWVYQVNEPGGTTQGMATQPTKGKGAWEGNEKEESVWEEAVRTMRKREKEELERKRQEEIAKKKAEDDRMQREYQEYLWREKKRNEKLQAERDRLWREKFQRN
ncbi:hypothetical protein QYE76_021504 [Lolium multiflorum]|uniref:Reverse transcriptase Ty1/copia-type domain-containing protein n=1 Tax=Lolium multiflorum TaxID=4521 RepID=A0AAD8R950_LOLMU|nr:hypothetical protein QYE76_021504 [Lolium multiflorum]